jgi:hypothetical protein
MLDQVIDIIKGTDRPVSLQNLSQRMAVEQSALSGMLDLLVRKGKLKIEMAGVNDQDNACGTIRCSSCVKESSCPFIAKMPVMYALKEAGDTEKN